MAATTRACTRLQQFYADVQEIDPRYLLIKSPEVETFQLAYEGEENGYTVLEWLVQGAGEEYVRQVLYGILIALQHPAHP